MLTDLLIPLLLILFLLHVLYEHLRSPLHHIPPAHPTAPISRLWILSRIFTNQRNRSIHAAHLKHGPIVRLGPSEISINDPALIKSVYSAGSGFDKPPWYHIFTNYGSQPMFALLHTRPHAQRKKVLSNIYSNSFISTSPALATTTKKFLETRLVPLLSSQETHEVHELYNALAMDFVTAHLFTQRHSTNFVENETERHWFLVDLYQSRRKYFVWSSELPGVVRFIEKATFGCFRIVPTWVDDVNSEIEDWCMKMCNACEEDISENKVQDEDCVYYRLRRSGTLSKIEAASEILDHIGAGHETTGVALTYATHHLSISPYHQSLLRDELSTTKSSTTEGLPTFKQIDSLPFLNAVILETLRLDAPIPGSQPRITPATGCTLGGYYIPAGVTISGQAWSLHRAFWSDPEVWRPERWLGGNTRDKVEGERWLWMFGSGGRGCIGKWLAIYEMKMTLAAIYSNFETKIVDDTGIESDDRYTTGPLSNQLLVGFHKL